MVSNNNMLKIIEWLLIALAKYITDNNKELGAKICRDIILIVPIDRGDLRVIRVDTLVATTPIKFMYLVKYVIFILNSGFKDLYSSNSLLFNDKLEEESAKVMQLVILAILVITENYIDKIVLNLGRGTWVKRFNIDLST